MPEARVETGPVRIGDDWAGVFVRGDEAASLAILLESVAVTLEEHAHADSVDDVRCRRYATLFRSCREPCEARALYASPVPQAVEKDGEGRPYQCGAFVSNDSRWECVRESDHEGDHDWRIRGVPQQREPELRRLIASYLAVDGSLSVYDAGRCLETREALLVAIGCCGAPNRTLCKLEECPVVYRAPHGATENTEAP